MLKFSIRIFEFYCELFKANNIRSFSIQYKIYGWIVFNRSLIQHLSFTVLRFVQSLMKLSTVKKIQKDASSFIFQRLSSRPDPDQPSPPATTILLGLARAQHWTHRRVFLNHTKLTI